jgi:hypothetical protein
VTGRARGGSSPKRLLALLAALASLLLVATASAGPQRALQDVTVETQDWILVAPASVAAREALEVYARGIQLCTDELVRMLDHRPRPGQKFLAQWIVHPTLQVSHAGPGGFVNYVPAGYVLDPPAFTRDYVARGRCFGPHELTHVLTADSWGPAWANEGFAQLTDHLFESASWQCCTMPLQLTFACEPGGYRDGPELVPYADLRGFAVDNRTYETAACFWLEVLQRGGFPAIRKTLGMMRARPPGSSAELVAYVERVLGAELDPIVARYGFGASDLAGPAGDIPAVPREIDLAVAIGTAGATAATGVVSRLDVRIANRGPDASTSLVLTGRLPAGARVVTASSAQGSCTLRPSLRCELGAVPPGADLLVRLELVPVLPGRLPVEVSVAAGDPEPAVNRTDNAAAATLTARTSRLVAIVGPDGGIRLPGRSASSPLAAASYSIVLTDRSSRHRLHLSGAGVGRSTGRSFRGSVRWTATLRPGTLRLRSTPAGTLRTIRVREP